MSYKLLLQFPMGRGILYLVRFLFFLTIFTLSEFNSYSQTVLITDTYGMPGDPQSPANYTMHVDAGNIPNGKNGWEIKALQGTATSDTVFTDQYASGDQYVNINLTINRTGNLAVGDSAILEYSFDGGTTYYPDPLGDWSASNRIYFARTFYLSEISVLNIRVSLNTTVSQAKWWVTSGDLNMNQSPTADSVPTPIAFFIGDDGGGSLPIELLSFEAQSIPHATLLSWTTLSETKNSHFNIEKSTDGICFKTIGKVNGNGSTQTQLHYQFQDESSIAGTSYYRLRQVDYDGASHLSNTISMACRDLMDVRIYPNPCSDRLSISTETGVSSAALYTLDGKLVMEKQFASDDQVNLNVSMMPQGKYILKVQNQDQVVAKPLLIRRQ